MKKSLLYLVVLILLIPGSLAAEGAKPKKRRGLVTSTSCPYTCADAGLSADVCVERQIGTTCQIEDFTQAPGHRSMVRVSKFQASDKVKVRKPRKQQR